MRQVVYIRLRAVAESGPSHLSLMVTAQKACSRDKLRRPIEISKDNDMCTYGGSVVLCARFAGFAKLLSAAAPGRGMEGLQRSPTGRNLYYQVLLSVLVGLCDTHYCA